MALQISTSTDYGVTATEGYVKISRFRGDKDNISVIVETFYNNTARTNGDQPLKVDLYETTTPTSNTAIMTYLYNYLKTLGEFEGAQDV